MELFYVDGFAFSTKEEYNLASHEAKNVSSIRAQLNWENKDSVMLVYRRLAAKGIFVTPVGLSFIKELRTVLVERFSVEESSLPMIRVVDHKAKGRDQDSFTKEQLLKDNQKKEGQLRCRMIVIVGLILVIIGMFAVTLFSPNSNYYHTKEKVLDQYSSWEEQLNKREKKIREKEEQLGITPDEDAEETK